MRAIEGNFANFDSPDKPAGRYRRGQRITIKYQRNNHGPGGFIRLTLVHPQDMMNKKAHTRNAFHYSCWGAKPVVARPDQLWKDQYGFSIVGNDGEQHQFVPAYYTTTFTIPPVVPDGKYVLGWVWYGGIGGPVLSNKPQKPTTFGYFGDYWSCSFVEVKGGIPLKSKYKPIFKNDMSQFSTEGCMSANDAPGVCTYEPCYVTGTYQKPRPFKNGRNPLLITPSNFIRHS